MIPISQILEIQSQDRGNKKKYFSKIKWLTLLAQYVKSQLVLLMKPYVVTNVIN